MGLLHAVDSEQLLEGVGDGIGDDATEDDQREEHEGVAELEHIRFIRGLCGDETCRDCETASGWGISSCSRLRFRIWMRPWSSLII